MDLNGEGWRVKRRIGTRMDALGIYENVSRILGVGWQRGVGVLFGEVDSTMSQPYAVEAGHCTGLFRFYLYGACKHG